MCAQSDNKCKILTGEYCGLASFMKFKGRNIDGQSVRQPVFAIQLEILNGKILADQYSYLSIKSNHIPLIKIFALCSS